MYCPKCRMPMIVEDGRWFCTSGQLDFSRALGARLAEAFAADYQPDPGPQRMQLGPLYCPGCGVPVGADWQCPRCGKSLRPFIHQLIELHPHGDGVGGWR